MRERKNLEEVKLGSSSRDKRCPMIERKIEKAGSSGKEGAAGGERMGREEGGPMLSQKDSPTGGSPVGRWISGGGRVQ